MNKSNLNKNIIFAIITELGLIFKLVEPDLAVEQVQEAVMKFLFYTIDDLLRSEKVVLDFNFKGNTGEDWDILFSFLNTKVPDFPGKLLKLLEKNLGNYIKYIKDTTDEEEFTQITKRLERGLQNLASAFKE